MAYQVARVPAMPPLVWRVGFPFWDEWGALLVGIKLLKEQVPASLPREEHQLLVSVALFQGSSGLAALLTVRGVIRSLLSTQSQLLWKWRGLSSETPRRRRDCCFSCPCEAAAQVWAPLVSLLAILPCLRLSGSCQVSSPYALPPEHAPHLRAFIWLTPLPL